jgi:CRP-like cAMP-binding protein
MGFSYDDPPNRVKEVMMELLTTTPGVLTDPPPLVRTVNYADFSVTYRLIFSVARQEELSMTRDAIMTRLWYVARREGLTIPYPIQMEYSPGEHPGPMPTTPSEWLREHSRFRPAIDRGEGRTPNVVEFAAGETIQAPGKPFHGFALIVKGKASLSSVDTTGKMVSIGEMGPGECFGDQVAIGSTNEQVGIQAIDDLTVLVFDNHSIGDLLKNSPALAAEIGDAIESRRQAVQSVRYRR